MARQEILRALNFEDAAWNSPEGIPTAAADISEPEHQIEQTTLDVIAIFDERQALAHNFSSRFHLLDTSNPPSAPHLPREIVTDDYSEDSMP